MSKYTSKMLTILQEDTSLPPCFTPTKASKLTYKIPNAFSLPAGITCPGKTKACEGCYAMKGNHVYPSVQKAYARNYKLFDHYRQKDDAVGCGEKLLEIVPQVGNFRIHESGDFQDQFAVDVWDYVVSQCPRVLFWFYTRSFHLDFGGLISSKNVQGFVSVDDYNTDAAMRFLVKRPEFRIAFGPFEGSTIPLNSFACPATGNGKLKGVRGACQKCKLCFTNKSSKNVVFYKH